MAKRVPPALGVVFAAVLLLSSNSWAAPPPRYAGGFRQGYEFDAMGTWTSFDDKSEIKDDLGFEFRFGWLFNPNHEIEFTAGWLNTEDDFDPTESVDLGQYGAAYVFNFTSHGVVPYFTAGLGFANFQDRYLGDETDPVATAGLGLRFFMGRTAYFRPEIRWNFFQGSGTVFADNTDFSYGQVNFGFGWRFPSY